MQRREQGDCFRVATRVGSRRFSMVCVCPASFRPFLPPPVGCLALASLRYRCTVTAGDEEGMDSATQEWLPGAWEAR